MNRLIRGIAIGAGGAFAVGSSVYLIEQQQLAQREQPVHLSSEWNFDTRKNVLRAGGITHSPVEQAKYYERAIDSLVNSRTDLKTKSHDWLAGYADLLRALALAKADADGVSDSEVLEPLNAASTIPFGSDGLRAAAAALQYRLTGDPECMTGANVTVPHKIESEQQLKLWGPYELEAAEIEISQKHYMEAIARLLNFHRSVASTDLMCFRSAAGGLLGQVLWKMKRYEEARKWLEVSEIEASQCQSPACREVTAMLRDLLARAASS